MYRRARHGEYNLGNFLRERPEILGGLDLAADALERDDAEVALLLAPAIGQYQKRLTRERADSRGVRAAEAAQRAARSARCVGDRFELDPRLVLGDLLRDGSKKYIAFELPTSRVQVARSLLFRARGALRGFEGITAAVDPLGVHLGWRGGRGGLHFRRQTVQRRAPALTVDLREVRRSFRPIAPAPVFLADILAGLGFG